MNNSSHKFSVLRHRSVYYLSLYKEERGSAITIRDYEHFKMQYPGAPSVYHIAKSFGTWRQACKKLGLRVGAKYTEQDVFDAIEKARESLGTNMTVDQYRIWAKRNGYLSTKVFLKIFGSWSNALWAYDKNKIERNNELN